MRTSRAGLVLLLIGGCVFEPPPIDPRAAHVLVDELEEQGACGDLRVFARHPDGTAQLLVDVAETPMAAAMASGEPQSWIHPLERNDLARVRFVMAEQVLPDPCAADPTQGAHQVLEGLAGRVRLFAWPEGRVSLVIEEAILIADREGGLRVPYLLIDDVAVQDAEAFTAWPGGAG